MHSIASAAVIVSPSLQRLATGVSIVTPENLVILTYCGYPIVHRTGDINCSNINCSDRLRYRRYRCYSHSARWEQVAGNSKLEAIPEKAGDRQ